MSLSAEQEADCQEAFTLFDRGGAGKLKVAELGCVLRALGHNLAGDELCVVPPCLWPSAKVSRARCGPSHVGASLHDDAKIWSLLHQ